MIICPNCNSENEDNMKFCGNCGLKLPDPKKTCPKCKTEWPLLQKFCGECGYNFSNSDTSQNKGISMGNDNVIAGDVIGSKEDYHISGNATIVKNEDETKKTSKCHICGRIVRIIEGYECSSCKSFTCIDCFDKEKKQCLNCSNKDFEQYEKELEIIYSKGHKNSNDIEQLKKLQQQLGISDDNAKKLENKFILSMELDNGLTEIDSINLSKIEDLFMNCDDTPTSFNLIKQLIEKYPNNEKVITLYLQIIEYIDYQEAYNFITNFKSKVATGNADYLSVHLSLLRLSIKLNKLDEAEKELTLIKRNWSNFDLSAYEAHYYLQLADVSENKDFLTKVEQIIPNLDLENSNKFERSYSYFIKYYIEKIKTGDSPSIFEVAEELNIYPRILRQVYNCWFVVPNGSGEFQTIVEAVEKVPDNAILYIAPDVYHENVVINKPIAFICADSEDNNYPIICGYNEGLPSVSSFAETYFYNIYFANNKNSNGILISNSNCILENCAFVNNGKSSLYAKDKADVTIANCFFDTNITNAINIENSKAKIQNTEISDSKAPQLVIHKKGVAFIEESIIKNGKHKGIIIDDAEVELEKCSFSSNETVSIEVRNNGKVNIENCDSEDEQVYCYAHDDGEITGDNSDKYVLIDEI